MRTRNLFGKIMSIGILLQREKILHICAILEQRHGLGAFGCHAPYVNSKIIKNARKNKKKSEIFG